MRADDDRLRREAAEDDRAAEFDWGSIRTSSSSSCTKSLSGRWSVSCIARARTRPAPLKVLLRDQLELIAQGTRDRIEVRLRVDAIVPLIDEEDAVDDLEHARALAASASSVSTQYVGLL